MATIPSGNGTDPWKLLSEYTKGQQAQQKHTQDMDLRRELQANQLASAERRAQMASDPQRTYDRTAARLRARIDNGFGPGSGRAAKDMTGSQVAQAFKAGLVENGITNPHAIAALMGNAQHESSFSTNALGDTNLGAGREAHGIMQWREGRFKALQDYAAAKGTPWTDPKTQGGFAAHELTTGGYGKIGQQLNGLKSMDGGQQLMRQYLGYDVARGNEPERMANSDMWFKKATGTKPMVAGNKTLYRDENDPTHLYRTEPGDKGIPYQLTQMKLDQAMEAQMSLERSNPKFKGQGKRMVELDNTLPMKDGKFTYRVYTAPPPLPDVAPPPVAAGATPEVTGAVVPPVVNAQPVYETPPPEAPGPVSAVPPVPGAPNPLDVADDEDEQRVFSTEGD